MKTTVKRGLYNEIALSSLNPVTRKQALKLFEEAKTSEKIDEHGNWEFGSEFDRKGRGYAINWDLYGVGRDYFSKRLLIVIQIRKYEKRYKNGFGNIQKSYFLIGRNEDNTAFAHPVESRVIHSAINKEKDVIRACQDWIFGCDYTKVIRQGDLALIPIRTKQGMKLEASELLLQESHKLEAKEIYQNGCLYAKDPCLHHLPQTHPDLVDLKGWYKVVVGKRGHFYDFATPTID
jgi:hypothetical protein